MDIDASVERPLVLCGDHGAGFLDVSSSKTFLVLTGMESNKLVIDWYGIKQTGNG